MVPLFLFFMMSLFFSQLKISGALHPKFLSVWKLQHYADFFQI